jgi:hypothetical protein
MSGVDCAVGPSVCGPGDAEPEIVRGTKTKVPVEEAQAAIARQEVAIGDQPTQMGAAVEVVGRAADERWANRTPSAVLRCLPLIFRPLCGSTIVRFWSMVSGPRI